MFEGEGILRICRKIDRFPAPKFASFISQRTPILSFGVNNLSWISDSINGVGVSYSLLRLIHGHE